MASWEETIKSGLDKEFLLNLIYVTDSSKSDREFIETALATFKAIRAQDNFSLIKASYHKKLENMSQRVAELRLKIPLELKGTFESIENFLNKKRFFQSPAIHHQFCKLQGLVEQLEIDKAKDNSLIRITYLEMKQLLDTLLWHQDATQFVSQFGVLKLSSFPQVNLYTGSFELTPRYLYKQRFSPSIDKIQQLNTVFYSTKIEDSCIALELLYMMERYYSNTVQPGFADQIRDRFWSELQEVKNDNGGLSFFNRVKILSSLNRVFQELYYESVIGASFNDSMRCNIISLCLDEIEKRLLLDVYCPNEMRITTYLIHQFKGEKPICFQIMQKVFKDDSPRVNVSRHGVNGPSKFFERTGLVNKEKKKSEIIKVFFEDDDSCIKLKCRSKACALLSIDSCIELSRLISTLRVVSR